MWTTVTDWNLNFNKNLTLPLLQMSCASVQAVFWQDSSSSSRLLVPELQGKHHPQSFLSCCLLTLTVLHKPRGTFQLQPSLGFKKQNPLWYIPVVSEPVRFIRPRGQCQEIKCSNVIQTWRKETTTSRRLEDLCFFQIPQHRRMRSKHGGMSVAYFHTFAYFSERRRGSFIEGSWWDGGGGG